MHRHELVARPLKVTRDVRRFVSYEEAKVWAKKSGIQSWKQWSEAKRPLNMPSCPWRTYALSGDWIDWGTFLGTGVVARQKRKFLSYLGAAEWGKLHGIKTKLEWSSAKKPANIPYKPDEIYTRSGDWNGWHVFLHSVKPPA
jgi:hypothetical protein